MIGIKRLNLRLSVLRLHLQIPKSGLRRLRPQERHKIFSHTLYNVLPDVSSLMAFGGKNVSGIILLEMKEIRRFFNHTLKFKDDLRGVFHRGYTLSLIKVQGPYDYKFHLDRYYTLKSCL